MNYIHLVKDDKGPNKLLNIMINDFSFKEDRHHIICVRNYEPANVDFGYTKLDMADAIKYYYNKADMIFVHDFELYPVELIKLKKKLLKKVVWIEWGHDLYFDKKYKVTNLKSFFKVLLNPFYIKLKQYKLSNVYAIGMPNVYDGLEARRLLGKNPKLYLLNYWQNDDVSDIFENNKINVHIKNKDKIGIMIGHSAFQYDDHINVLKHLNELDSEKTIAIVPLNYGDMNYAQIVKNYLDNEYKYAYMILDEKLPYKEYWEFISNNVDIAIFSGEGQNALGNLSRLCKLHKKIYINPKHIFYTRLIFESKYVYTTNDFYKESIKEIIDLNNEESLIDIDGDFSGKQKMKNGWVIALSEIKKDICQTMKH